MAIIYIHLFYVGMNINLDFIKFNTNIHLPNKSANISFKAAASPKNDTFERTSALKNIDMTVYNPFDNVTCTNSVRVDLSKPQKIHLKSNKPVTKYRGFIPRVEIPDIELDYNPKRTGVIWDKEKNKQIKVVILKSSKGKNDTAYHFMSPNLKKEYGYVYLSFCDHPKEAYSSSFFDSEIYLNYPEQHVTGPRVVVDFLQNNNDSKYGGIGKLADKTTVRHCLENGIEPVIVSVADCDSHVAHYLRGKRFLPLPKDSEAQKFFMKKYGSTDVNKILEKLIADADKKGEKVDLTGWGFTPMYMPQELAQKYINELKSEKK